MLPNSGKQDCNCLPWISQRKQARVQVWFSGSCSFLHRYWTCHVWRRTLNTADNYWHFQPPFYCKHSFIDFFKGSFGYPTLALPFCTWPWHLTFITCQKKKNLLQASCAAKGENRKAKILSEIAFPLQKYFILSLYGWGMYEAKREWPAQENKITFEKGIS